MYNFIRDVSNPSNCQSVPSPAFIPRTFRSKVGFFRLNQLPPIAEEEGNWSENEAELANILPRSPFLSNERFNQELIESEKSLNNICNKKKLCVDEWVKNINHARKLCPFANVNCLMNVNVKQQHPIWNTSFGKRLINGKTVPETLTSPSIKKVKKEDEKLRENQSSKSHRSFLGDRNGHLGGGDKIARTPQPKKKNPKPVQDKKISREIKDQKIKKPLEIPEIRISKSETNCIETSLEVCSKNVRKPSPSESLTSSIASSRTTRSQNLLSKCVKNILENTTATAIMQYICENCDQVFSNVEELCSHKKKHENEKEICVLCKKVFNKSNEFVQHLVTHENMDKFTCKKCKKCFQSLKKYKIHCKQTHMMGSESTETEKKTSGECMKKWVLKYKCKKCQLELDSDESFRAHKKNHFRADHNM